MEMMGEGQPQALSERCRRRRGRRPMYMRSTTLYSTLISWATVMGRASRKMLPATLPLEKSFVWGGCHVRGPGPFCVKIGCLFQLFYRKPVKVASGCQKASGRNSLSQNSPRLGAPFCEESTKRENLAKNQTSSQIQGFSKGGFGAIINRLMRSA